MYEAVERLFYPHYSRIPLGVKSLLSGLSRSWVLRISARPLRISLPLRTQTDLPPKANQELVREIETVYNRRIQQQEAQLEATLLPALPGMPQEHG